MLASGERLPVLVDRTTGEPLFDPAVYSVSELRSKNLASNSIESALRAIMVFYTFLELRHIELDQRIREGALLTLGEVEELVRTCRLPMKTLSALLVATEEKAASPVQVVTLEKFRMKQGAPEGKKEVTSAASRIHYIRNYLVWLVEKRASQHGLAPELKLLLESAGKRIENALNARSPVTGGRNTIGGREGLAPEALDRLLEVIHPDCPENPWHGRFARIRNQLAIHWLFELGIRRGELLGIEVGDINFRNNKVTIARKADSRRDPRRRQPLTKTLDRVLPISERMAQMTNDYIMHVRKGKKAGLPHGFLFVSAGTGAPLSLIGLNKMFEVLRKKCPDLPKELVPHVLRHTANDIFSKKMDEKGISDAVEQNLRSLLFGWSPRSTTAKEYTKRHVREKGSEVLLDIQNDIGKQLKK
jgi:integrase